MITTATVVDPQPLQLTPPPSAGFDDIEPVGLDGIESEVLRCAFVETMPRAELFEALLYNPLAQCTDYYAAAMQQVLADGCGEQHVFGRLQNDASSMFIAASAFVLRAHHRVGVGFELPTAAHAVLSAGLRTVERAVRAGIAKGNHFYLLQNEPELAGDLTLAVLYRLARQHDFAKIPTPNLPALFSSNHVFRSAPDAAYFVRSSMWPPGVLGTKRAPDTATRLVRPVFLSISEQDTDGHSQEDDGRFDDSSKLNEHVVAEYFAHEHESRSMLGLAARTLARHFDGLTEETASDLLLQVTAYVEEVSQSPLDAKGSLLLAARMIKCKPSGKKNPRIKFLHIVKVFDETYQDGKSIKEFFKNDAERRLFCALSDTTHHPEILAGALHFIRTLLAP